MFESGSPPPAAGKPSRLSAGSGRAGLRIFCAIGRRSGQVDAGVFGLVDFDIFLVPSRSDITRCRTTRNGSGAGEIRRAEIVVNFCAMSTASSNLLLILADRYMIAR